MGILRRRPPEEPHASLDDLVGQYSTESLPTCAPQGIGARRCPNCGRTVVFDARHGEGKCPWCASERKVIDLDRGERMAFRDLARSKRRR